MWSKQGGIGSPLPCPAPSPAPSPLATLLVLTCGSLQYSEFDLLHLQLRVRHPDFYRTKHMWSKQGGMPCPPALPPPLGYATGSYLWKSSIQWIWLVVSTVKGTSFRLLPHTTHVKQAGWYALAAPCPAPSPRGYATGSYLWKSSIQWIWFVASTVKGTPSRLLPHTTHVKQAGWYGLPVARRICNTTL